MPAGVQDLARVVDSLVICPETQELEFVLSLVDRLQAKVAGALDAFDAKEGWQHDGSLSLTAWLASHGLRTRRDAHCEALTARRLQVLPATAAAWEEGRLSSAQVSGVMANVSEAYLGFFAEQEEELVPALEGLSAGETAAAMRLWRLRAEALDDAPAPRELPSQVHLSRTLEGRRELSGHLGPEDSAVVEAALATAAGPPAEGDQRKRASELRAEALVGICRWFLDHSDRAAGSNRNRPYINVVVDLADLATGGPGHLPDGTWVSPDVVAWLSCDSELHRIVTAGRSSVLDYGTATRTISQALWGALVVRDGHCRHPGCDRPPAWSEAHHVVHFSKGGPTCLPNLVMACHRHHHLWHEPGWSLTLSEEAVLTITTPWGEVMVSRPPPRCGSG